MRKDKNQLFLFTFLNDSVQCLHTEQERMMIEERKERGMKIAALAKITRRGDGSWRVPSMSGADPYTCALAMSRIALARTMKRAAVSVNTFTRRKSSSSAKLNSTPMAAPP